ncbi:hypothetical protein F5Y05DRAFT_176903 [Hypoxylon sp. FL0543]|nr:hypothetical protein F5Y05DRAFT_176903 [Hypoxylon sp. FL0543]
MGHDTKKAKEADEAPPPPYSPATPPSKQTQIVQTPQQVQAQPKRHFPRAFNMYRESSWTERSFMLGEHQGAPLYAVTLHSGWSGQPDVVLHNGPSEALPPLAGAARARFGSSATVTLRPIPGSGLQPAEERVEARSAGFGPPAYAFAIEVGGRRESFEWRHSSGGAVKALGARGSGWKLVRLATGAPAGIGGDGGASFVGRGVTASDGKEVVAVWAWASGSLTKKLKFQFLGSGANGVLGERWAIMAVITALRIWDRERRQRNSSAAAGGAGAGA